jgi:hypothetical protein
MSGVSASSCRTRDSNGVNDVGTGLRSYFGGPCEVTALMTVVLETPTLLAIAALVRPSAASLLINAQSSTVITLQSSTECSLFERRHCLVFSRRRHGVVQSLGGVGSSADNALAASFNATLKRETLAGAAAFTDSASCRREIFRWAVRYNTRRRHSYLRHQAPNTYENTLTATLPEAA